MKALFVELPPFMRFRADYLDDDSFSAFQQCLMKSPNAGDVIEGVGGLRKLRYPDARRGKGKRGGLRVIYFWWELGQQGVIAATLSRIAEVGSLTGPAAVSINRDH